MNKYNCANRENNALCVLGEDKDEYDKYAI